MAQEYDADLIREEMERLQEPDLSTQEVLMRADADELERIRELELQDIIRKYMDQKKFYRFEGDSGLKNLEQFLRDLGYSGHPFRFGSPIESFLSDNPGACGAIIEWIELQRSPEWKENLESCLPEEDDEDDSSEDE